MRSEGPRLLIFHDGGTVGGCVGVACKRRVASAVAIYRQFGIVTPSQRAPRLFSSLLFVCPTTIPIARLMQMCKWLSRSSAGGWREAWPPNWIDCNSVHQAGNESIMLRNCFWREREKERPATSGEGSRLLTARRGSASTCVRTSACAYICVCFTTG